MNAHISLGGYNLTWGGTGVLGLTRTKEANLKISKSLKGRYKGLTHKERYGSEIATKIKSNLQSKVGEKSSMFGKKHTNETKKKMSNVAKGKPKSKEHRKNIGLSSKGKTWEERYGIEKANEMRKKRRQIKMNI